MAKTKSDIVHVLLSTTGLDAEEKDRDDLVGALQKLGPVSALALANPAIQTGLTNVVTTYGTYKKAGQTASASAQQHASDVAAAGDARVANDKAIRLVANLIENDATTEKQVTDTGFKAYTGKPPAPPLVYPAFNLVYGKKGSGKAKTVAQETGPRRAYLVETSPNPITTWTTAVGGGKTRKLTGASGTSIWVRYALRQGQLQSDWSPPVLVTFP